MNTSGESENDGRSKIFRRVSLWVRRLSPFLLILFALIYYGSYYRSGLNLGGEGGTVAVDAQRIMAGQRPIADVFLGYNVLWFYPVVWLFQIVGPNYIALRIFFFALCTITALLAWRAVWRVTALPLYALGVGILLLCVPGMIFRNYMGLLGVLNILVLLEAWILPHEKPRARLLWIAAAAAALSLTFLIRVDAGFFLLPLHLALILLYSVGPNVSRRIAISAYGLVMTVVLFFLLHLPVYRNAEKRGFGPDFAAQYREIPSMMSNYIRLYVNTKRKPAAEIAPAASSAPAPATTDHETDDIGTRPRPSAGEFLNPRPFPDRLFAIALYLPVPLSVLMLGGAACGFLLALFRSDPDLRMRSLAVLASAGAALAFFPQYYFFRPDLPHLSEFMCPFLVALAIAAWCVAGMRTSSIFTRVLQGCFLALVLIDVFSHVYYSWKRESSGSIAAARHHRHTEFRGQNGVHVLLNTEEARKIRGIYNVIMKYSAPDDYVICYPYSPTVNFMTNRKSYLKNLYVDNATAKARFHDSAVREIQEYRPAVILIDNRPVNQTDASRFSHWAVDTWGFIRQNYRLAGTFGMNEVYVRPDKLKSAQP